MNIQNILNALVHKSKMTETEKDTLLSELIACYYSKCNSDLMRIIEVGDIKYFKERVIYMNECGTKIKEGLTQ